MQKSLIVILIASLVASPLATASDPRASEGRADCERDDASTAANEEQPWIGYTSSAPIKNFVEELQLPFTIWPCEGEHWDGQDTVQPDNTGSYNTGCVPSVEPESGFIGACMYVNNNDGGASAPFTPLGSRVSWKVQGTTVETFIGVDIAVVGRVMLYNGACQGGAGLEGDSTCDGSGQTRTAAYARDNTLGGQENILAQIVSAPGLTKGYVSEGDCDQATYQRGAVNNDRTLCGRDNTAATIEVLLP